MEDSGMKTSCRIIHGEKKENKICYEMHQQLPEPGSDVSFTDNALI